MGGLLILHTQPSLTDRTDNMLHTSIRPHRTVNFNRHSKSRRKKPAKSILTKTDPDSDAVVVTEPPSTTASNNLVMGQVKILKRGEALEEPSSISKEANITKNYLVTGRHVLHTKKKTAKCKILSDSNSEVVSKTVDDGVSSKHRLGCDAKMMKMQMEKMTECYAGYGFGDSPSPSLVPLPRFFIKN
ncbi:hypothetical protein R6Q59_011307 [Mikania micrantha]